MWFCWEVRCISFWLGLVGSGLPGVVVVFGGKGKELVLEWSLCWWSCSTAIAAGFLQLGLAVSCVTVLRGISS